MWARPPHPGVTLQQHHPEGLENAAPRAPQGEAPEPLGWGSGLRVIPGSLRENQTNVEEPFLEEIKSIGIGL